MLNLVFIYIYIYMCSNLVPGGRDHFGQCGDRDFQRMTKGAPEDKVEGAQTRELVSVRNG